VLSPKDLCSIGYIDKLIESGIDSFKIEGRKRSPEYVAKTVSVYRRAIDLYFENNLTED
jgi:U32 family peptidase